MNQVLNIIQIVTSILLVITILLQHRGTGLGGAFGGESNVYRSKRGIEKFLFQASIVLAIIFALTAILNLFY